MAELKGKIKVGDYLYKLSYYTHPFKRFDRVITKRKVLKLNPLSVKINDFGTIAYTAINSLIVDEWHTSKEIMYRCKLKSYLKENEEILKEIEYLEKKSNNGISN